MPSPLAGLKIVGLAADTAACGNFRIKIPMAYLRMAGIDAIAYDPGKYDTSAIESADIIVAQRIHDPMAVENLLAMRSTKTIIYELDDDLHNIHRNSPAYYHYKNGGDPIKQVNRMLEGVHGLTLSTLDLAAQYYTSNKNIHVLENQIDYALRDWDNPIPRRDDALYVGWTGGAQHQEDMAFMATWLPEVILAHDHVKFLICTNLDIARDYCENHLKLPLEKYEILEPRKFEDYPPVISHIDIGLAPVEKSKFNCAKSGLKICEYGSWGVATIASKFVPYQRLVGNREDVLLVENTATAWINAVNRMIEDESLRKQMGRSLRKYVRANHDMKDHIHRWAAAYADIREIAKQSDLGRGASVSYLNPGRNDPCPCGSRAKYKKCCFPAFST